MKNKSQSGIKRVIVLTIITCLAFLIIVATQEEIGEIDKTTYVKEYSKNISDLTDKYGTVAIKNDKGNKILEYKLLDNTDYCLKDCSAEGIANFNVPAKLFENIRIVNLDTNKNVTNELKIYYSDSNETYDIDINDYADNCSEAKNGSNICDRIFIGTHKETKERKIWKVADKELNGTFFWRIEGTKGVMDNLDWIGEIDNKIGKIEMPEYATWNSTFENGLLMYYDFNESNGNITNVFNPTEHNSTSISGVLYGITGIHERGLQFIGNSLVKFNYTNPTTAVDWTIENWTISFWFNSSVDGVQYMIGNGQDNSVSNWLIGKRASAQTNSIEILGSNPNWADLDCISTDSTPLGIWTHIAVVKDGTLMTIYTNGSGYNCANSISLTFAAATTRYFKIGGYGAAQGLDGYMDEVSIYNRALSPSEVLELSTGTFLTELDDLSISLNFPSGNLNTLNNSFNCSAISVVQNLKNISLIIDDVRVYTILNTTANQKIIGLENYYNTSSSGIHNWTCEIGNETSVTWGTANDITITLNITGKFTMENGTAISGGNIIIINETDNKRVVNLTTNSTGGFTYPLSLGNYSVNMRDDTNQTANGIIKSHIQVP